MVEKNSKGRFSFGYGWTIRGPILVSTAGLLGTKLLGGVAKKILGGGQRKKYARRKTRRS